MQRRERVVAQAALGDEDRVLEVVAAPGHVGDEQVLADRELALVGGGAVREDVALLHPLPLGDDGPLVEAGAGVGAAELLQLVAAAGGLAGRALGGLLPVGRDEHVRRVDLGDDAGLVGDHDDAGVARGGALEAGGHVGALRAQQRHRLAHHVGAHQRAVRVVVLEERDEAGGDGDHLHRAHVHELDAAVGRLLELAVVADADRRVDEVVLRVEAGVGLRDDELLLLVGGHVDDLVRDVRGAVLLVLDLAVGRLDEAVLVDLGVDAERGDEADVRALGRLDRADAAVVRGVHVAHLEARAVAREAAGAEGREAALVGQAGERVGLVHELGELAAGEELVHHGAERLGVHEARRAEHLALVVGVLAAGHRHALVDRALRARQADAALVLEQLARGADAAGAEVVDVVDVHRRRLAPLRDAVAALGLLGRGVHGGEEAERGDDVALVQHAQLGRELGRLLAGGVAEVAQLQVELVAADLPEVVAAVVEEEAAHQLLRVGGGDGVARAEAVVDVLEGLLLAVRRVGAHRLEHHAAVPRHVQRLELGDAGLGELVEGVDLHELVAVRQERVRLRVADVLREDEVLEAAGVPARVEHLHLLDARLRELAQHARGDEVVLVGDELLARAHVLDEDHRREARRGRHRLAGGADRLVADRLPLVGVEVREDVAVRGILEAAQERRDEELAALAAAVHVDPDLVVRVELELEPRAAVRDDADGVERRAVGVHRALRADARGAVQLGDDDALGAVDDERAVLAHERDVAEVDPLADRRLAVAERELDVERGRVGDALAQRGERIVLGLRRGPVLRRAAEAVLDEVQHVVPVVALDREDALEDALQADVGPLLRRNVLLEELLVGLGLDLDLVGRGQDGPELAEDGSFCHRVPRGGMRGMCAEAATTLRGKGLGGPRLCAPSKASDGTKSENRIRSGVSFEVKSVKFKV